MSLTRSQILDLRDLRHRKVREQTKSFIVEGAKSVMELRRSPLGAQRIWATAKGIESLPQDIHSEVEILDNATMNRISSMKNAPGVLALGRLPVWSSEEWHRKVNAEITPLVLVADAMNDPGNVGTMIRTAEWFGCAGIVLTEGSADAFNAKSVQASMGSVFRLPILNTDSSSFLGQWLGDVAVLDAHGTSIYDHEPRHGRSLALVVGSESHGPSEAWLSAPHNLVGIPKGNHAAGVPTESLNAAIAAAIGLSEINRKLLATVERPGH